MTSVVTKSTVVTCGRLRLAVAFLFSIVPCLYPTITHVEWKVVPTGEVVQSWTGLAVDEFLLVWLSDGAHQWETIRLPCGRNVSRHSAWGLVKDESRRLGLLRFDYGYQYPCRRRNKVIHTYHTQHDVPYPVRRLSNHSSAQDR